VIMVLLMRKYWPIMDKALKAMDRLNREHRTEDAEIVVYRGTSLGGMLTLAYYIIVVAIFNYQFYNMVNANSAMTQTIFLSISNTQLLTTGQVNGDPFVKSLGASNSSQDFVASIAQGLATMTTSVVVTAVGLSMPVMCVDICKSIMTRKQSAEFEVDGGWQNVAGFFRSCRPLPAVRGCRAEFEFGHDTTATRWLYPEQFHFSISFPGVRATSLLFNITNTFSDGSVTLYAGSTVFSDQSLALHSYVYTRVQSTLQFTRVENRIDNTARWGFAPIISLQELPVTRNAQTFYPSLPLSDVKPNATSAHSAGDLAQHAVLNFVINAPPVMTSPGVGLQIMFSRPNIMSRLSVDYQQPISSVFSETLALCSTALLMMGPLLRLAEAIIPWVKRLRNAAQPKDGDEQAPLVERDPDVYVPVRVFWVALELSLFVHRWCRPCSDGTKQSIDA
jgi:hypothetical protein